MRRVEVGFFSFTVVPEASRPAYDAWHRLDHLPEQYAIDGIAHGRRWEATPACVAARLVDDPVLGRATYVTLYLVTEPVEATLAEFRQLAVDLRAADRFFADREAVLAGPWRLAATAAAPRVQVRPAVVPWRPATGVYVVVEAADAPPLDPALLGAVDGVAGCWTFEDGPSAHRIAVAWLDADPVTVAPSIAAALAAAGRHPVHAGPYTELGTAIGAQRR
jgi:hypothetical protein